MKRTILTALTTLFVCAAGVFAQQREPFPYPTLPAFMSSERAEVEYLVEHFWDRFDFASYQSRYDQATRNEALATWADLLAMLTGPNKVGRVAEESICAVLDGAAAAGEEAYWYFLESLESLFYDANSPVRCDEHFVVVCSHATDPERSAIDEVSARRYASLGRLVERNRPGNVATDFAYTLPDGRQRRLHNFEAELLVLYFYNPGCSDCGRVKQLLEQSSSVAELHRQGRLGLLAVYPDAELELWRDDLANLPEWWVAGYDSGSVVQQRELYDLKAVPTLYLLDGDKRVILKDPDVERLLWFLDSSLY